jgi:putative ABC transport system substrate-binding protein
LVLQFFRAAAALCVLLLLSTMAAAQQPKIVKLGYVSWFAPTTARDVDQLRQGLRELGYAEGRNFEIEAHFTDGDREKTREALKSMVDRGFDFLIVSATPAAHLAKELTGKIPIVMSPVSDPVATGLVQSFANPGGNLTGMAMVGPDLAGKRLELLREIKPDIGTVAFLGSTRDPNTATFVRGTRTAADKIGIKLIEKMIDGPDVIDEALFQALKREGAEAVVVQPIFLGNEAKIVPPAMKAGLPVVSDYLPFVEAGALLTFGVDRDGQSRRAAYFIDRILKGASPAELPIEQPTSFKLGVNAVTAKALGWSIPPSLLFRADVVIE